MACARNHAGLAELDVLEQRTLGRLHVRDLIQRHAQLEVGPRAFDREVAGAHADYVAIGARRQQAQPKRPHHGSTGSGAVNLASNRALRIRK